MQYNRPQLFIETFEQEDIITTSLTDGGATGGDGGSTDFGDLK